MKNIGISPKKPYHIGSQSAPYGAPGLRERNLGAPQAIRLLSIFFYKIYCGSPSIMVNLFMGSITPKV